MHSLRWRIAGWYAALLVAVLVAIGALVTWRFDGILQQQVQTHLLDTLAQIKAAGLPPANAFAIDESFGDPLLALESPDTLARWASSTTFVEIDDVHGNTLAKSFNLGSMRFPPASVNAKHPKSLKTIDAGGRSFLLGSEYLSDGAHSIVAQVGEPLDGLNRALAATRQSIALILAVAVAAVAFLSFVLASQATNPINELAQAMREIGSEGLSRRLRWKGRGDEIGRLADTFDDLLARLEEAFARERQFISDASHELRTPLTSINANAQMLARWGDRDDAVRKESLETIVRESASLANMVGGMLTLAKADSGDQIPKEPLSLAAVVSEAVEPRRTRASEKGLQLQFEPGTPSPIVIGDPALIRQLAGNLIDNAIKFTDEGFVRVRVHATQEEAILEVQDSGPGIDPQELPLVFDRFYRTDKSRNRSVPGTGLGLAIVRSIARVHGGSVEAERPAAGGTLFRARFPRVHE